MAFTGGSGGIGKGLPECDPYRGSKLPQANKTVTANRRIAFFRILSSFRVEQPPSANDCDFFWAHGDNTGDKGQGQGRDYGCCGEFYRRSRGCARLPRERFRNENLRHRVYENSIPSSSSFAASAGSGVKSEDKCAPASNIRPEIKAQNIRATEIENAWP